MNWLDYLRDAKVLLDELADTGADWMRKTQSAMEKIAAAIGEAADIIDPTPGAAAVTVSKADCTEAEALLAEFKTLRDRPKAMAAFPWEMLIPIIISLIEEFLKRRRPVTP